jgi:hypothetical protein
LNEGIRQRILSNFTNGIRILEPHAKAQRRKGFGLEDKKDNKDNFYNK